ncbi:uncharacterized protein LOC119377207 [Rhipicephalus sanguineus]|uniref:uncharacterized protein LOC119377207 n=1 Tax=Rhipicephalus sanguineus TaxID=34632 RepID=UPI00189528E2|nr:uncharacterized protein LOC119377207 [Rhipicephalus sanguineus]
MDAGTPKRAYSMDHPQGLDEATVKRRKLTPSSNIPPTAPIMAHQINPSPYAGVSVTSMCEEMQWLQHHQQHCLQWAVATYRLPEATVGSVPQDASVGGHRLPVHLGHPPFINQQMGLICERLMNERHRRVREDVDGAFSA